MVSTMLLPGRSHTLQLEPLIHLLMTHYAEAAAETVSVPAQYEMTEEGSGAFNS